ncbi:MAG: hypothetical protein ABIZ34_05650 [Candidatus Limnocylindrales bacterium]
MQDSVAAIRASRSRARYVVSQPHRSERSLGLHRLFRTPAAGRPADASEARRQPLKALRVAARGLIGAPDQPVATGIIALRREPRMRWPHADGSRTGNAAPWRG